MVQDEEWRRVRGWCRTRGWCRVRGRFRKTSCRSQTLAISPLPKAMLRTRSRRSQSAKVLTSSPYKRTVKKRGRSRAKTRGGAASGGAGRSRGRGSGRARTRLVQWVGSLEELKAGAGLEGIYRGGESVGNPQKPGTEPEQNQPTGVQSAKTNQWFCIILQ